MSRGRKIAVVLLLTVVGCLLLDDRRAENSAGSVAPDVAQSPADQSLAAEATVDSVHSGMPSESTLDHNATVAQHGTHTVPLPRPRSQSRGADELATSTPPTVPSSPVWLDTDPVVSHAAPVAGYEDDPLKTESARRTASGHRGIRFTGTIEALH